MRQPTGNADPKTLNYIFVSFHQTSHAMESELIEKDKAIPKGAFHELAMNKGDFLTWEPTDEPFTYEFNNGIIESKPGTKQNEAKIVKRIARLFQTTTAFLQGAELLTESDCRVTERQMHRPDMAQPTLPYFDPTVEQALASNP
jgi:hypothetical protein